METFTGMLLFIISNKNMASNLQMLSEAKLQYLREKYENHPQIVSGVREIGSLPSCWVWNHAHKRKDDDWKRRAGPTYPNISICPSREENFKKFSIKGHILFHYLFTKPEIPEKGHTAISHLCHNKRCVNPSHLNLEPYQINTDRSTYCNKTRIGQSKRCCGHGVDSSKVPDCIFN